MHLLRIAPVLLVRDVEASVARAWMQDVPPAKWVLVILTFVAPALALPN